MIIELVKRSLIGIGIGSIISFFILTILLIQSMDASIGEIWRNLLASMLVGMYFSVSSMIFESEKSSLLKQTILHFSLTLLIILPVFILAGWIPFTLWSTVIGLILFVIIYLMVWISIYSYYKRLEKSMNESITKKD